MAIIQPFPPPRLYQSYTTLTNASIKTLPTVPVTVIPASSSMLLPIVIHMVKRITIATLYTNVTNAAWYLCYENNGGTASTLDKLQSELGIPSGEYIRLDGGVPQQNTLGVTGATSYLGGTSVNIDEAGGAVLLRDDWTSGGNYTGGGTGNKATITILYYLLDVTTGLYV